MTPTLKILLGAGAVVAVLTLAVVVVVVLELKGSADSPLHIELVTAAGGWPDAPTAAGDYCMGADSAGELAWTDCSGNVISSPNIPSTQPGQAVGFAFYSETPRAQTSDISILAHHTAIPVNWSKTAYFDAQFLWPPVPTGWTNSDASCGQPCGYRGFAFPGSSGCAAAPHS